MPTTISAHHGWDEVEGSVRRWASSVVITETVAPNGLEEGGAGASQSGPRNILAAFGRVGDGDLEEGVPERETKSTHVRPVHQSGIGLFGFRPEFQTLQLTAEFVAKLVVALGPCARIAEAEGRMFAFRVIPTSGVPSSSSTVAARSSFRIQRKSQTEAS